MIGCAYVLFCFVGCCLIDCWLVWGLRYCVVVKVGLVIVVCGAYCLYLCWTLIVV